MGYSVWFKKNEGNLHFFGCYSTSFLLVCLVFSMTIYVDPLLTICIDFWLAGLCQVVVLWGIVPFSLS